jgi:hypothetical protein
VVAAGVGPGVGLVADCAGVGVAEGLGVRVRPVGVGAGLLGRFAGNGEARVAVGAGAGREVFWWTGSPAWRAGACAAGLGRTSR